MTNSKSHKWSILLVVTLVSFITNLDSTIVIIGLPNMMEGLNISVTTGLWIITGYIIASTVLILPAGKWADTVGTKRIFVLGLIIFAVGTILCGIADSGLTLNLYRLIQGGGAALAMATATPTIIKTFHSNELGLALSINATSWVIGAIIGPVAGGALISSFGWRSIFFITVPFVLFCIIGAFLVMEETKPNINQKNDWIGILTFSLGLILTMIVLSEGQSLGWVSYKTLGLCIVTILLWVAFIITELRVENPVFNFKLLLYRNYSIGLVITLFYCIAYFSLPLLLSIYLQSALHLSPTMSGLLMISLSVPQLILGPFAGKLVDNIGSLKTLTFGIVFLIIGIFFLGNLGGELSVKAIVTPLILLSIANGLAWPSLAKTVLSAVPKEQSGSASGMHYTIMNVGKALSQTLAILTIEVIIPADVVSKAIIGLGSLANVNISGNLVKSIDSSFRFFTIFFVVALGLSLFLLYSKRGENIKEIVDMA
ncbi:MFS transporter [Clostridium beijerinckii]|uniref:MFS transporter n=1 Tax=Clostridium beijerinckii TaxID=1520 RepID=A0AAW3W767_CLOBE|nr:MFS transporter [Clostridium beijerinckii]MBC2457829.1 MFS transporter [Clostridium beijerinckii]MBC2474775.1 MFS transporter [Clostridium beijerinckii]NOV58223.1 EmrB/QacA subfamily drug resistance transporter [Clostridium beijerinckii]NOV69515.1 EmrB/QacA subfamily drug resistance transporter [Clostridium beijerinckii]NOW31577.1 EmrB/QacA subfamily drug resistance transporter [Clostridium beijerinckii]